MATRSFAKTGLRLIAGCSLALLVGAGCGTALAHGGGGHSGGGNHFSNVGTQFNKGVDAGNFGHDRCRGCGGGPASGTHYSGHNIDGAYWHHYHHRNNGPGGLGTVHGPGSSHNPIVYHPPVRTVRAPIAGVGPAKLPKNPRPTYCQLEAAGADVMDHRGRFPRPVSGMCH